MTNSQGPTILVVDDEAETRKFLGMNLNARGFGVRFAADGSEALKIYNERPVDLVLLDITMPGPDGLAVCQTIRRSSNIPIIMLSANARESDKVSALDMGADDYLTKPFGVAELLARVNAAIRRGHDTSSEQRAYSIGNVKVDLSAQTASVDGVNITFTSTEFKLLSLLLRNQDRVLTHRYILQYVWGNAYVNAREYLRAYMYRLRKKIEADPRNPRHILSVPGVGYRLCTDGAIERHAAGL